MSAADSGTGSRATTRGSPARSWPEPWASAVFAEAEIIEGQLRRALAGNPMTPKEEETERTVLSLLHSARDATDLGDRTRPRPSDRWRGTSLERAHYCLHGAKVAVVDVLPPEDVTALIPLAAARIATCLPPADIRRTDIEALLTPGMVGAPAPSPTHRRAVLKRALQIGYEATDQLHARIRGFRNLLVVVAATIFLFMAVLVGVVSLKPTSVPFCFHPPIEVAANGETSTAGAGNDDRARAVCPSGHDPATGVVEPRTPKKRDISIVAGLGMIGGALAAAVAIRNVNGTSTPYDVPLALAILKVPTGALTAVSGILLLSGGFVPGFSELDSQGQILAYGLVLGYAQQLVTGLIDRQAMKILDAVPSKDATGSQPAQISRTSTTVITPTPESGR